MLSEVDRINKIWDSIEAWYAKNGLSDDLLPGASVSEIHNLEAKLDLTLPESLKVSLARHNGIEYDWPKGRLLGTDGILEFWEMWGEMTNNAEAEEEEDEGDTEIIKTFWSKYWIPIESDDSGAGALIDLSPGPKGKVGQILYFDDHDRATDVIFENLAALLEDGLRCLEEGKNE